MCAAAASLSTAWDATSKPFAGHKTFFREVADPEATGIASVAHVTQLVKKVLKSQALPPVHDVSDQVLSNDAVVEYLDLMAHTPWNEPRELLNSSEHVMSEALSITSLALLGFHFAVVKLPGRGKIRGLRYGSVLGTVAKAANFDHALTATSVCAAAEKGDLLELRWYMRRAHGRQQELNGSRGGPGQGFQTPGRSVHGLDREGRTPLHHAASQGEQAAVALLLDHWAALHGGGDPGGAAPDTLLEAYDAAATAAAARQATMGPPEHRQRPKQLDATAAGQGPRAHDDDGDNEEGAATARLVLKALVDVEERRGGNTALHLAAQNGHVGVVKLLLKRGAAFDKRNHLGRTPMACAAAAGVDAAVVEALFDAGADVNDRTNFGDTVEQVAMKNGHSALAATVVKLASERRQAEVDAHRDFNDLEEAGKADW